jgi:CDP-diacylglycerol--serine O-phosphatidyltransferase
MCTMQPPMLNEDEVEADAATPGEHKGLRQNITRRGIGTLPTMFTLGNLLCGCAAIFIASRPSGVPLPFDWTPLTFAAILVFGGMVFDALDGRVARLTRSTSDLGGQLDSMADMVTFGVVPAFLVVQLVGIGTPFIAENGDHPFERFALLVAAIYACCAALRLARFNLENTSADEADHLWFKGLPSPGAAGTVASLVLLHQHFLAHERAGPRDAAAVGMVFITLVVGIAMVSRFRYIHVMNRYVRHRAPIETIAKAVVVGLLLLWHIQGALAAAFVLYAVSAPAAAVIRLLRRRTSRPEPEGARG